MSDGAAPEILDIFARRVLAKAELLQKQEVFQENYSNTIPSVPLGTKAPLTLYIINHGALPISTAPNTSYGSPVKCVKLCKRILDSDPGNTILCTQKSKVVLTFELVLVVEYEDNTFDVMTLPKDLAAFTQYVATTKAFVEETVLSLSGTPVIQHQSVTQPYEQLVIKYNAAATAYANFEYTAVIPLSSFSAILRKCELNDPTLQSYIVLRNLTCDVDVQDQFLATATETQTIWTTVVDFSLSEDIIDKLGIDQDIQILGTPEYVCLDDDCGC
ncbi:MAG: hypothetical protein VB055_06970 [Oscillospiraceae bacterium]|nr:hypothetical protein [Oscillospiraceae bacterium]